MPSLSPTAAAQTAAPFDDSVRRRLGGLLVALGAAGVLGIALWLNPAPEGHGTHTQLGLPGCAWAVALNRPCPTCGMTTAFAFAVRGRLAEAFQAQPFGLLMALGTGVAFWAGVHVAVMGSHLGRLCGRLMTPRVLWALAALAAAAWAYKWVTWPRA